MIHSKKGQLFMYGILAGLLGMIIVAHTTDLLDQDPLPAVGTSALSLIDADLTAQAVLVFTHVAATYSTEGAIVDLARQGGGYTGCGTYRGVALWNTEENPDDLTCFSSMDERKDRFVDLLARRLSAYIKNLNELYGISVPHYDVNISDMLELKGTANAPFILGEGIAENIEYREYPNFEINARYDLTVYEQIKTSAESMLSCVKDGFDVRQCIVEENREELEWSLCDSTAEELFYGVAQAYDDCLTTEDMNCVCQFDFTQLISGSVPPSMNFRFDYTDSLQPLSFSSPELGLAYDLPVHDSALVWFFHSLQFLFGRDNVQSYRMTIPIGLSGKEYSAVTDTRFTLFRHNGAGVDRVDVVYDEDDQYWYPNQDPVYVVEDGGGDSAEVLLRAGNQRTCRTEPMNTQRFCVTQKNERRLVYDEVKKSVAELPVIVRFALHLPQSPPPPLTGLEVTHRPKSNHAFFIQFDKSEAADARYYRVYYTPSIPGGSRLEQSTEDLFADSAVATLQLDSRLARSLTIEDLSECRYEGIDCLFGGKSIENGRFYDLGDSYLYSLLIEGEYDVGVTALDEAFNEIDNVLEKMPVSLDQISLDTLAPSSERIIANEAVFYFERADEGPAFDVNTVGYPRRMLSEEEDGLVAGDFRGFEIYYTRLNREDEPSELRDFYGNQPLSFFTRLEKQFVKGVELVEGDSFAVALPETAGEDDVFYFVVVAYDQSHSEKAYLHSYTPYELGAMPLRLEQGEKPSADPDP